MSGEDLRIVKTKHAIYEAFLACLKEIDFLDISVKDITQRAVINRSTFYKHYRDKFDLRDQYVDSVIDHFLSHLDTDFVAVTAVTDEAYFHRLRADLLAFYQKRDEYLTLWQHNLQSRNVYEEMLVCGAKKLEMVFENAPTISREKSPLFSFYAISFISRMLVSIRWWFTDGTWMDVDDFTHLMIQHMSKSLLGTLRGT